ncbi:hypothetical protein COV24_04715 [candidate division WWE3 bacterium CG10_big_fil_rev_8_21_14_0_10_32_10]|uniref:Uncharacterized protein n=1 Tax=candidate division WWE3 bacterium CG10_big_fil_rev_8_21_14_0_10_32_10 TaxID=1975090 RepID=A0A2H0R943_UNCKA|nr:MAG: hypothetical protein COV24_04715 [candidate division WWE3 bacterium CG10_big_fil_rev_8_21_14_0_10_32_10]
MKLRNLKLLVVGLFIFSFFLIPQAALVETFKGDLDTQMGAFAGKEGIGLEKPADPRAIVAQVIKILLSLLGILFLIYTIYAGYLIMSSAGDQDKVSKGKSTLRTAAIGVFVILISYSVFYFVANYIGLSASGDNNGQYSDYGNEFGEYN